MDRIQWLTSLEKGKRTVAILLVGIASLFTMLMKSEYIRSRDKSFYEKQEIMYRKEIIHRTDSFNMMYYKLVAECNDKMEIELRAQLNQTRQIVNKVNKTVRENEKIINTIRRR